MLEREIKLRFDSAFSARATVIASGAAPIRPRRLQRDCLLDTDEGLLRANRAALRIRIESGGSVLTFKGPVQPSTMKLREEIETTVDDSAVLLDLFERLGFRVWFRCEKYREEFALGTAVIAIDETPVGVFVEIEGDEPAVESAAAALGRSADDYLLDSYRGLFARDCDARGVPVTDMVFEGHDGREFRA